MCVRRAMPSIFMWQKLWQRKDIREFGGHIFFTALSLLVVPRGLPTKKNTTKKHNTTYVPQCTTTINQWAAQHIVSDQVCGAFFDTVRHNVGDKKQSWTIPPFVNCERVSGRDLSSLSKKKKMLKLSRPSSSSLAFRGARGYTMPTPCGGRSLQFPVRPSSLRLLSGLCCGRDTPTNSFFWQRRRAAALVL